MLRVSSKSNPNATAGAIANVVRTHGRAEIQVIGAGAVNQAIKAIAIARGFVEEDGFDLVCSPDFADVEISGQTRTAIVLVVTTVATDDTPPFTIEAATDASVDTATGSLVQRSAPDEG